MWPNVMGSKVPGTITRLMVSFIGVLRGRILVIFVLVSIVVLVLDHPAQQVNRGNAIALLPHSLKTSWMSARIGCGMLKQSKSPRRQQTLLGKI